MFLNGMVRGVGVSEWPSPGSNDENQGASHANDVICIRLLPVRG